MLLLSDYYEYGSSILFEVLLKLRQQRMFFLFLDFWTVICNYVLPLQTNNSPVSGNQGTYLGGREEG